MYLLAKFGGRRCNGKEDISFHINSYVNSLEEVKLTDSIRHIARLLKSGMLIYKSKRRNAAARKIRRRKT